MYGNTIVIFSELIDGKLHLKEQHDYYHQIQGQLHITNKNCCDLVVWTAKDFVIYRIQKSKEWSANIAALIDFYFNKFIPALDNTL